MHCVNAIELSLTIVWKLGVIMRKLETYIDAIDTMYPDGYARETQFRDSGDMVAAPPASDQRHGSMFWRMWSAFSRWQEKRSSRLVLRDFSEEQLRDIGLTRREAEEEVRKSFFWD